MSVSYYLKIVLTFVLYYFTAKMGLNVEAVGGFATLIWPPTGISLAILLLNGLKLWPGIALGAFAVNLTAGAPLVSAVGVATGNTLEAVVAFYLLTRIADFHKSIDRVRDVLSLVVYGAGVSTLVSASIGVTSLWLGGAKSLQHVGLTWVTWWTGDALGAIVVAPLILLWCTDTFKDAFNFRRIPEALILAIAIGTTGVFIFGRLSRMSFWVFPFVIWSALRFGQLGNVTAVFVISSMAIWGMKSNLGPFVRGSFHDNLFLLNSFIFIIATTGLTVAAALAERNQAIDNRDEFFSIASHELKTPLTSLSLQVQMAEAEAEQSNDDKFKDLKALFSSLMRQIDRLAGLVENLLDVSNIQSGKLSFSHERLNISKLVQQSVDRLAGQLRHAKCDVHIDIQSDVMMDGDPLRLEQVMDNLLSNVIRHAPDSQVKLSLLKIDGKIRLIVEDDGPGIPKELQQKVFQRQTRISTSTHPSGLGLGLYIVKTIVESHNGSIHLESETDQGARFIIELLAVNEAVRA